MCDYSLTVVPNRLAVQGEQLIVHRFASGTKGLASPADLQVRKTEEPVPESRWGRFCQKLARFLTPDNSPQPPAVCIPPGASLVLRDLSEPMRRRFELEPEEVVTFVQLSPITDRHRDAVRFRKGHSVLLQELEVGQRVDVLGVTPAEAEVPQEELSSLLA